MNYIGSKYKLLSNSTANLTILKNHPKFATLYDFKAFVSDKFAQPPNEQNRCYKKSTKIRV